MSFNYDCYSEYDFEADNLQDLDFDNNIFDTQQSIFQVSNCRSPEGDDEPFDHLADFFSETDSKELVSSQPEFESTFKPVLVRKAGQVDIREIILTNSTKMRGSKKNIHVVMKKYCIFNSTFIPAKHNFPGKGIV